MVTISEVTIVGPHPEADRGRGREPHPAQAHPGGAPAAVRAAHRKGHLQRSLLTLMLCPAKMCRVSAFSRTARGGGNVVGLMLLVACSVAALVIFSYRGFSRLRRLAREAPRNGEAVRAREAGAARVAELNEMTVDLESSLKDPAFVPGSCARAALALGTLVALIQVSQRLAAGGWRVCRAAPQPFAAAW